MTIGQAHQLALLNTLIKWSLSIMIVVLIACIVQYTIYQPWWKDPIGRMIVALEIFLLAEAIPQLYAQFFVHSVQGTINMAYVAVGISLLVSVVLVARFATWAVEQNKAIRQRRREAEPTSGP